MKHRTDALELLLVANISHVGHLHVIVQIVDVLGLEPEDAIVEECLG